MALIPADAGIRMRMQTETNLLQPVAPAHEVPSDLPDLVPGRTFTAQIQEALPENTYRALVAGKSITLSLPEGAKTGDRMELVVVDRAAGSIVAKQVQPDAGAAQAGSGQPYPFTRLSPAAQLIGELLPAEGQSPPPAQLNRGQPLMSEPPVSQSAAIQLAPTLAKAVTQSGLFYEAHQAQWVSGKLPLTQLLQEPQGRYSAPAAFQLAASEPQPLLSSLSQPPTPGPGPATASAAGHSVAAGSTADAPPLPPSSVNVQGGPQAETGHSATSATSATGPAPEPSAGSLLKTLLGTNEKTGAGESVPSPVRTAEASLPAQKMPEELRPLVQQQLEAVATSRVFWHGEIWPQQSIDWEIEWERENENRGHANPEEDSVWRTALSLTTPRLGHIDATLQLTSAGVRIALAASDDTCAADLRDASPQLAEALAAAGVPLLAFQVKQADERPANGRV